MEPHVPSPPALLYRNTLAYDGALGPSSWGGKERSTASGLPHRTAKDTPPRALALLPGSGRGRAAVEAWHATGRGLASVRATSLGGGGEPTGSGCDVDGSTVHQVAVLGGAGEGGSRQGGCRVLAVTARGGAAIIGHAVDGPPLAAPSLRVEANLVVVGERGGVASVAPHRTSPHTAFLTTTEGVLCQVSLPTNARRGSPQTARALCLQ